MEKYELFVTALKSTPNFNEFNQAELASLGQFLGGDYVVFKDLYRAYIDKKSIYENKPIFGAKVEVAFDWEQGSVTFKRLETKIVMTHHTLLQFLSLVDTCFLEIYPIGSVVELELEMMSEQVRRMYHDTEALVSISGRKVWLGDDEKYFVDYVGRLWPFGEGPLTPPIFLSNAHIRRVMHTGFKDEIEEKFVQKALRLDIINGQRKSIAYLTDKELKTVDYVIKEQDDVKEGII